MRAAHISHCIVLQKLPQSGFAARVPLIGACVYTSYRRSCSPEYGYGDQSPSPKIPVSLSHRASRVLISESRFLVQQRVVF